jgi:ATP-dependent exoDNAse (exonuclease V) beta subunit
MGETVLTKDTDSKFPHFTVLKASAGSGKTYTLTERFVQFLLSEKVPKSGLRNMLAVTFSNNAAKEMKEKTLLWLKNIYFGDEEKTRELSLITSMSVGEIKDKAGVLIDEILDSYSDFQVKTIDSFMTTVFKASAIDFGYNPDFDILMNNDLLMGYAFNLFLRNVSQGTPQAACLEEIVDKLLEQKKIADSYMWDPSSALLEDIKKIHKKISSIGKQLELEEYTEEMKQVQDKISSAIDAIDREIRGSSLTVSGGSSYSKTVLPLVRSKNFPDLIGKGFARPPVTKPKAKSSEQAVYELIVSLWNDVKDLVNQFGVYFTRSRCLPCIKAYQAFKGTMDAAKKEQGKIFIEDINMQLAEYLDNAIVPAIYFRLGETIYHFLIDEFQDTSPIQWRNFFPLIENSLSQDGSLFVVGDTKQAIYGFRNADYMIMKGLEEKNPFPSAEYAVRELKTNYRSKKRILEFNEKVFMEKLVQNEDYKEAGERSGLTKYVQNPKPGDTETGYVEVSLLERNDEDPAERSRIQELIEELRSRGYRYGDIAILTQTNKVVVNATTWLSEKDIDFISYSSLDVRRRKVTGEIISLMNFLDSPTDDHSFGTFILGDAFTKAISKDNFDYSIHMLREFCFAHRNAPPLYKAFQAKFNDLWQRYFSGLFKAVGFLPLYDLVTEVFAVFGVFGNMPEEEATLVKILEVAKEFEGGGFNSLKDFLGIALDDEKSDSNWDMAVPQSVDAVKVMTIHKAKGLGFPVAIVLLYEESNRGFDYLFEDRGETACLLKITKDAAACDSTLQEIYDRAKIDEMVNRLNKLYVVFTRPKRELYVIGVKGSGKGFPFPLLPAEDFPSAEKPKYIPDKQLTEELEKKTPCQLLYRDRPLEFLAITDKFMTVEEKRRGEFIHRVMFFVDYVKDGFEVELLGIIRRVKEETGLDYDEEEVKSVVMAMTSHKDMAGYFMEASGRRIRKEQEYADGTGQLFRMDRVVIDRDGAVVIDYKTGKDKEAQDKYRAQLRDYMRILGEVYTGKAIKGIVAFVDLCEMEKLS